LSRPALPLVQIGGTPAEIGDPLGQLARPVMADFLARNNTWKALQPWRGHRRVARLAGLTEAHFPELWQELADRDRPGA
jgi:hypothetical protein